MLLKHTDTVWILLPGLWVKSWISLSEQQQQKKIQINQSKVEIKKAESTPCLQTHSLDFGFKDRFIQNPEVLVDLE